MPWADCKLGTSELIGEDPSVIVGIDASQLMNHISRCNIWSNIASAWIVVATRFWGLFACCELASVFCFHTLRLCPV